MVETADPRARERVGAVLDEKWTLERLLGIGGMGAVYAGRHRNGARAAVKVLHPELARIAEVRERFLREGYAANRVEHRGAVQVLDDDVVEDGDDAGSAYLVMELLEGDSLDARAARDPKLGERELLEILDAVLDVLASAHAHGVVHRDLKPENIFLAEDPERDGVRVKVLDFGLARIVDTSNVTNNGLALGTPSFMSPEQAAGRREEIDGQTDIFALGATAFRIVTERRIHEADNMVQLVVMMATKAAPKLRDVHPASTPRFAAIVDRALAFEKKDRYPDATSMQKDVRAALEALGVRAPNTADGAPASLAARDRSTVQVLPYSTRNVPLDAFVAAGAIPNAPGRGEATSANDAPPSDGALAKPVSPLLEDSPSPPLDDEAPSSARRSRATRRPATLPWLIAVASLSVLAWTYGPALHRELSRHTARPPVPDLWGANATSQATAAGASAPNGSANMGSSGANGGGQSAGPSGEPALSSATLDDGDGGANPASDAGAALFELGPDAGSLLRDAGADAGDDDDDDGDDDEPVDGGPTLASNHAPAAALPPGAPHSPVVAAGPHPSAGRPSTARPKPAPGTPARHPHAPTKKHRDKWQRRHH